MKMKYLMDKCIIILNFKRIKNYMKLSTKIKNRKTNNNHLRLNNKRTFLLLLRIRQSLPNNNNNLIIKENCCSAASRIQLVLLNRRESSQILSITLNSFIKAPLHLKGLVVVNKLIN